MSRRRATRTHSCRSDRVTLFSGEGPDTDTELYWGRGSAVWNNGGDTVFVTDDDGATVIEESY